jgi:hypothetical protein
MHYTDDNAKCPNLPLYVGLTVGPKKVMRYLHVRRRDTNKDEEIIINIFDNVNISSSLSQPNTYSFFIGSVTHEQNQGSVLNYFVQKRIVEKGHIQGNWVEYKVKHHAISRVRLTCSQIFNSIIMQCLFRFINYLQLDVFK